MLNLVTVGLGCIAIGWYIQLAASKKKKFVLQKNFLLLNAVGAAFLTLYSLGDFGLATILQASVATLSFLLYRRLK